jgi:diguanylate cyclase (GGDEF)-like protein
MMLMERDQELLQVLRELEFRMAVTRAMLSTLDLQYVLYVILCGVTSGDGLGLNRAVLFLDDEEGRELKVTLALGPQSGEEAQRIWTEIEREEVQFPDLLPRYEAFRRDTRAQGLTQQLSSFALPLNRVDALADTLDLAAPQAEVALPAVLARCLVDRKPYYSNELIVRQEVGGIAGELIEFRNVAVVPLSVEDRVIGVLFADNYFTEHPVDADVVRRLEALTNLAALAIDRARLHARTVAMAEIDGLTGVYNRRYYSAKLARSMETASRSGNELSIVVFDLDNFKGINDQHGHLVGDEVLKDVARIIQAHVRASDMVARYGGEEFVVLLKNTHGTAAAQVAEKLCQTVRNSSLAGGQVEGLTLSAGVAASDGRESAETLFARADHALYSAKQQGRDRVVAV